MPANPNDKIREQILKYFYDRNTYATSRFGKKGSAAKISDVKRELKSKIGLTQSQVVSNLTYLIDRKWINTIEVEKTVTVKGGTIPSKVTWYEISALGIEKIEGGSLFELKDKYPGINITATGSNIITLGDGNVVNAKFSDLHNQLAQLQSMVAASNVLNESQKLDVSADIESMKDQLAKDHPNGNVVRQLWSGVETAVTAGEFIGVVHTVSHWIHQLFQ
jgi:hypothetical protein